MNKGKLSFSLGKFKEKEPKGLGNVFLEEEAFVSERDEKKSAEGLDSKNSDNFQSISTNFEYKKSIKFYNEHPELLEDFDRSNKVKITEAENEEEKGGGPKKASLGKSKYLRRIQEYVELRNVEKQEIQEEKIQKEIQEEGNTQVFITDSYRDVLEERKKLKNLLTNRKLSEGEDPRISRPSNIFEMRLSSSVNELKNIESNKQISSGSLKEELNMNNTNLASSSTTKDYYVVNNDEASKTSKDLKLIKIQQAKERYLLRKQDKNSS
ncbi:Coiled-coil domain-containing protein 55 (DUF2040) family protein [Cryptosporidium meleagridis]|uniref:Coiled-coil domain-containing protein 55 (DUF2040) family protein n=1 Tax=Cryptosporidium meleagridis TaxID=93969 RepID=A0A2P4Z5Y5_9CRYT|nr:Coiled-coil domain-containing protein 55 (DUF2040) family protein [Cryptosporidium meleagridis]